MVCKLASLKIEYILISLHCGTMACTRLCRLLLISFAINGMVHTLVLTFTGDRYEPTWESLDKRPIPKWYDDVKIGIFLHWGVYSVPSFHSEWFWLYWKTGDKNISTFMEKNYPPNFTYQNFAKDFKAEFFDPKQWADLFKKSGAKYVVLTSKHHEGYTLWPSKYSYSWNAVDVGPNRDLLGDLAKAVRNASLKFGVYHSLYEWYNPLYLEDKRSNFTKNNFVVNKVLPEMVELIQNYQPEIIWSDGDWEASDIYWKATEFLAWLYNESPVKDTVVVNDRWGVGIPCHHGDFYNCKDRYRPGILQKHKWESAMTIDKHSWGYRRNANLEDFYSINELIHILVETISCGGNILLNVGPTHDGRIDVIFQERLLQMGKWLSANGEAIYGSKPWIHQNDSMGHTWYTSKQTIVYAITLDWPVKNMLQLGSGIELFKNSSTTVTLLENSTKLKWSISNNIVNIVMPDKAALTSCCAWALKIQPAGKWEDSFSEGFSLTENKLNTMTAI